MLARAEGQRQRELACARQIELAGERHVAIVGQVELPVHFEVVVQVGPAIAKAHVSATAPGERYRSSQCRPGIALAGHQHVVSGHRVEIGRVAGAAYFQVRRQQRIQPQLLYEFFIPFEPSVYQQAGMMRIGNDFLDDAIRLVDAGIGEPIPERVGREQLDLAFQVPALIVEECTAVADQILQVANLGPVDRGVVNFGNDAGGQREPDRARSGIGGADGVLVAARPTRLDARCAKRAIGGGGGHADRRCSCGREGGLCGRRSCRGGPSVCIRSIRQEPRRRCP